MEEHFDLIVIGGGLAGIAGAVRTAQHGLRVVLVEKDRIGGMHPNYGGAPTKALLSSVDIFRRVRDGGRLGIDGVVSLDWKKMQKHKEATSLQLSKFNEVNLVRAGIRIVRGVAKLVSPTKVNVSLREGGETVIEAKNILIASGSNASTIPGVPIGGAILDNKGALMLDTPPKSLVVVGGGAVGLEFATIFCYVGSKVTVIEMLTTLLPGEEPEVGEFIQKSLQKERVDVFTGSKATEVRGNQDGVEVQISTPDGQKIITVEKLLMAIGRQPDIDREHLESIGIKTSRRGVLVNERMQTSIPNIYAVGDVADISGKQLLTPVGIKEGKVAASNILGGSEVMRYAIIPRCIYTIPEVASVGLTEQEAQEKGVDVRATKASFFSPKAVASGENEGFIKILTTSEDKLIGATVVGATASELIFPLSLAIAKGLTAREMGEMMYPAPSFADAIFNTMGMTAEEETFKLTRIKG
jgi:dihydrolipoamide dehydrogenase